MKWVTRARPKVDRVACPWLIKRFVDAEAEFLYVPPDRVMAVANGELDLAAINPSAFLSMAYRGTGPYPEPLPVRVIAVMPSLDVMLFAVSERTGVTSLADLRERRYPLRASVRRSPAHGTRSA